MYLQYVSNKQKKIDKLIFVGILKATEEMNWIQIRNSVVRIHRSGSISKRLGARTLVLRIQIRKKAYGSGSDLKS